MEEVVDPVRHAGGEGGFTAAWDTRDGNEQPLGAVAFLELFWSAAAGDEYQQGVYTYIFKGCEMEELVCNLPQVWLTSRSTCDSMTVIYPSGTASCNDTYLSKIVWVLSVMPILFVLES